MLARLIPRVILYIFSHFCSFMVVRGFGVGVLNWVFWSGISERLGFWARDVGPSWVEAHYQNREE